MNNQKTITQKHQVSVENLSNEQLKIYKDFVYTMAMKELIDFGGLDWLKDTSVNILSHLCQNLNPEISKSYFADLSFFLTFIYEKAREIESQLENNNPISDKALIYIKNNMAIN